MTGPSEPSASSAAPTRRPSRVEALRRELSVPLFRNTYALMLNTVVNSGFGLLYWVVAARTYPETEVGRGNALTSLMLLVSVLTQLNVGQALVRFLPRAGAGSARLIGSAYGLSAGVGVLGAAGVAVYCNVFRPEQDPLHMSAAFGAWFVLSTVLWSLFTVQDSVLTGMRESIWIPLENGLYGVVKLVVLVVVAQTSISDGVFTSWTLPVVGLIIPVGLLISRRLLPRHVAATRGVQEAIDPRAISKYMAGDYAGQVFSQAGSSFLPVLVVALLGSANGAYFLPAQTVFVAINLLTLSITSSLVAEAARDPERAHLHARSVVRRLVVTVLPAALVLALAAPWVLQLYGPQYAANATLLLQLFMASILPRVVVALYMTLNRLRNRTWLLATLQAVQAAGLIGGVAALHGTLGLNSVGWATLGVEVVLALAVLPSVVRWLRGTTGG